MTNLQRLGVMGPLGQKVLRGRAPHAPKAVSISARVCLYYSKYNKNSLQYDKNSLACTLPRGNPPLGPTTQVVE